MKIKILTIFLLFILIACRNQTPSRIEIRQSNEAEDADILAEFGLTGINKPNGFQYRLRYFIHPEKPGFIPDTMNGLKLFILDKTGNSWLCFYRSYLDEESYNFYSCLYSKSGDLIWDMNINKYFPYEHPLEVQDIKFDGSNLFFNAACISYASESGYKCSSLICIDPVSKKIKWNTPDLTSNGIFILYEDIVISSYGFWDEKDYLFIIEKLTGHIINKIALESLCEYLEIKNDFLFAIDYQKNVYKFELSKLKNL